MRPRTEPPPRDLSEFPSHDLRRGAELYRIHRRGRGAWWFSGDLTGRFDLPAPEGTCYLAEDPLGAFVEVFRRTFVREYQVHQRRLATVRIPRRVRVADTTRAEARRFGVTLELVGSVDYDRTQQWAAAFRDAGFGGIRYRIRHDPTGNLIAIALFGAEGEGDWPAKSVRIPDAIVAEAQRRFGLRVLPDSLLGL